MATLSDRGVDMHNGLLGAPPQMQTLLCAEVLPSNLPACIKGVAIES